MVYRIGINNRLYLYAIIFTVYMVEMIVYTVTLSYFPAIFPYYGIDPRVYGFVGGLSLIPMTMKFFIGPISDKFPIPFIRGKRKGYIIIGGILNLVLLPFLSLNPALFFTLFFTIWFFQTLGVAIMDIMTSALSVDAPSLQSQQGRTQASLMVFFGTFVGGFIVTQFIPLLMTNLKLTLIIFALISIIPLGIVLFLKEPTKEEVPQISFGEGIRQGLTHPFVKWGLLFAFILNIDGGLLELTLEPYLVGTIGVSIQTVVADLFYIGLIGNAIAFLGYFFIDRIQKTRLLSIIALIYTVPIGILGYLTATNSLTYTAFLWLYGVFSLVTGLSFVTYIGLFYDLSDPKVAGTMVALFFTMNNFGRLIGIMISGFFTISMIYFISLGLTLFRLYPLRKIRMEEIAKTFYPQPPKSRTTDVLLVIVPLAFILVTLLLRFL